MTAGNIIEKWEKARIRHSHRHPSVKNINKLHEEKFTRGQMNR